MYTFNWSNGVTTEDISGIGPGEYIVTVTSAGGCSQQDTFFVPSENLLFNVDFTQSPNTSCTTPNGSLDLSIIPAGGYTFQWSTGSTSEDIQNLEAGSYSVTITDTEGCFIIASFVVDDHATPFSILDITNDNTSCMQPNGSINLSITPGGGYSFSWSNGINVPDLQNLSEGSYTVTVTDQSGCTSTRLFTITNNPTLPEITSNITPAYCGQSNGSVDNSVTLTNNNSYLWSNGQTSQDLVNVLPGSYQLTVTGGNACTAVSNIDIPNESANFTLFSIVQDDHTCINPTGAVDLTITPSGSYAFQWSNGSTTEDLSNLSSGIYEVTVTDESNCAVSYMYVVENTASLPGLSEVLSTASCDLSNGSINLSVQPAGSYQFAWSNGENFEDLENIPAGTYSVTVTDGNGCSTKADYNLQGSMPMELLLEADQMSVPMGGTVTVDLQMNLPLEAISSINWYPYSLMNCHNHLCMEQVFTLMEETEVTVMVTDTNGCLGQANLLLDIDKEFKVYIPNIFSPNRDGHNERFTVYGNQEIEEVVSLEIFDNGGTCVFINSKFPPNEPFYGWNGTYHSKVMNSDVFAYRAVVKYSNGEEHSYKGGVTLIR